MASLVAQSVKNLPALQETWVQSLGREYPLEEGMVTHFSILALKIPQTEEPGGLQPMGLQESDMTERPNHHIFSYIQPFACAVFSANRSTSVPFLE